MSILEKPPLHLEEDEVESVCFSDEGGSCYSQFYSTADGYEDILVEVDNEVLEIKVHLEEGERDCRICHMELESCGGENGGAIELGCSCKDGLAAAHKDCAETWFKIKGNKTCEICNSIAHNVSVPCEAESVPQTNEMHSIASNSLRGSVSSTSETQNCFNGHRFLNFLLACMVFAFIISWLFHFDIPS